MKCYSLIFPASRVPCFRAILPHKVRSSHALRFSFFLSRALVDVPVATGGACDAFLPSSSLVLSLTVPVVIGGARDAFPSSSRALAFCYDGGLSLLVNFILV